jgi:hypothetical protein
VGFVVDKLALWQVFFGYFGFPYQFSSHRLLHIHHHHHHLSSGARTRGQFSGRRTKWTQSHPTPRISDTHRKPTASITAVLLPFVTYLLTLPRMIHGYGTRGWLGFSFGPLRNLQQRIWIRATRKETPILSQSRSD